MNSLPPRSALAWICFVVALGIITFGLGVRDFLSLSPAGMITLIAILLIVLLADIYRVRLSAFSIIITVSTVTLFGSALVFGKAAVVLALGSIAADLALRRPWIKVLFNGAVYALMTWCSAAVWQALERNRPIEAMHPLSSLESTLAWVTSGVVFVVVNAVCVITVVALVDRSNAGHVARSSLSGILIQLLTLPTLGVLFAVLYRIQPWALILIILPLVALYYSLRSTEQVRQQAHRTIERLSDVLDRRDPSTYEHSQRVAEYCRLICEEMKLPADFTETVVLAARVHDLGKIAIPDNILFKPGKLTPQEWIVMRTHASEGADILAGIDSYVPSLAIIRHHHERWDGKGYPDGLAGEEIPLGARIVAVADTYDAMVSVRPYRRGLHTLTVLEEIERHAGDQFDPRVAATFVRIMRQREGLQPADLPTAANAHPIH